MTKSITRTLLSAAALVVATAGAHAAQVGVSSYDMSNGDGQAHGGSFNYWDTPYSGTASAGATTIDGLYTNNLSGGLGKLTDGVIATQSWYAVSNNAGTGPYVGWLAPNTVSITFHFASVVDIDEVKLFVDNSNVGGVSAPNSVSIGSATFANSLYLTPSQPTVLDFSGLGLHSDSVTVSMNYANAWIFLSEAQFFTSSVPEAGNAAMLLGGLGLLGLIARRRRA